MNEERSDVLIDLLIKQATEGLSSAESAQLVELESGSGGGHDLSFERTAAAIGMIDVRRDERMPACEARIPPAFRYDVNRIFRVQPHNARPRTFRVRAAATTWISSCR